MQITHRFNKLKPQAIPSTSACSRQPPGSSSEPHLDYTNPRQKKAPKMSLIRIMGQAFTATVTPAFTVVLEDQS